MVLPMLRETRTSFSCSEVSWWLKSKNSDIGMGFVIFMSLVRKNVLANQLNMHVVQVLDFGQLLKIY